MLRDPARPSLRPGSSIAWASSAEDGEKSVTRIGFIGLGIMGGPMAANLVRAGFEVTGCNRSRAKVDRLVEQGGRAAASVAEAVGGADVVVTVLPDSPDVQAIALGDDGIFANSRAGVIYMT
jgi:2-hydroxy-3-oxopropionate reductase